MADWPEHAIWWQLHPISFTGAARVATPDCPPGTAPAHQLARIEAWLDYLVDLGCNGLLLGPIFASRAVSLVTLRKRPIRPVGGASSTTAS